MPEASWRTWRALREEFFGSDVRKTGSSEKIRSPRARSGPFFSPRTRRAQRSLRNARSFLANLACFARGILRLGCPKNGIIGKDLVPRGPFRSIFLAKNAESAKKPSKCPKLLGELGALCERNSQARMPNRRRLGRRLVSSFGERPEEFIFHVEREYAG